MDTVTVKTSELIDLGLDWAAAKCEEKGLGSYEGEMLSLRIRQGVRPSPYSTDWAQGGPIIEREKFTLVFRDLGHASYWFSEAKEPYQENRYISGEGPTPLIAAMRCYVASKLGDTVQIPKELAQ